MMDGDAHRHSSLHRMEQNKGGQIRALSFTKNKQIKGFNSYQKQVIFAGVVLRKDRSLSGCSLWWRRWRRRRRTARSWCLWRRWSGCKSPWCPSSCSGPRTDTGCRQRLPRTCWSLTSDEIMLGMWKPVAWTQGRKNAHSAKYGNI